MVKSFKKIKIKIQTGDKQAIPVKQVDTKEDKIDNTKFYTKWIMRALTFIGAIALITLMAKAMLLFAGILIWLGFMLLALGITGYVVKKFIKDFKSKGDKLK